jgi:hypothetical protein
MSDSLVGQAPIPSDPEDLKLITLARAALGRTGAQQGAAVRDTDGRAYAAASIDLEHLKLSGIAVAVAMAVSSGAVGLEAVALIGDVEPSDADLRIVADLAGHSTVIIWAASGGAVKSVTTLR